ncbi:MULTISPECIES: hypothetical protein [unclassified Exiguobacterium]|uniref:hypothetical protein n=1 Tax=unclassified Exiguobacterium TaxID=2644629 RepID=UPI00203693D7|nr:MULTISPECIES: hypothetical protein [unclassified Exiguobacterium]
MTSHQSTSYSSYFWKRFWILFLPIVTIGILSEPMIVENTFKSLEDIGEFVFYSLFYIVVIGGFIAFVISFVWRSK